MAIEVTCPSCQSAVHVHEGLAGKDILCPNCKQRVTVPSIAAGAPEDKPLPRRDLDESLEEHDRPRRDRGGDMPRWSDDDYDLPSRRDSTRWSATLTGLAMIFWSILISAILVVVFQVAALAVGAQTFAFAPGPGAGPPPPGLMLFGVLTMGVGCSVLVLAIIAFVGLCMCCTAPAESGARGRAIATLILVVLSIIIGIIFVVAIMIAAMNQARQFGGPAPGQLPFSTTALIAMTVVFGLDILLMATLWMMFHKALADHFQNTGLARNCVWYLVVYIAVNLITNVLNFITNPMLQGGNLLMAGPTPMMYVASVVQLITGAGMMIWYLFIIRETRRTIREDQPAPEGGGEPTEEP